jgi:gamma-glutamyltranspeptidase/glutathione hydrolase
LLLATCGPCACTYGTAPATSAPDATAGDGSAAPGDAGAACDGGTFGLDPKGAGVMAGIVAAKKGTMGIATKHMVASSHALATQAGLSVLRAGGSAADAFVATALVEDIVLPGVTSTAGLAGVIHYDAATAAIEYVHGGMADPISPTARWAPGVTTPGRLVLVGGAPAAYATLVQRHGKLPFASDVAPAIQLATAGFPIDALYAATIASRRSLLAANPYAASTFFSGGAPLAAGATLKLPAVAATLTSYGANPSFFYSGSWATGAVSIANGAGGDLTAADYSTYAPEILAPMHGHFQGRDLYAGGVGGARLILDLEALDVLRGGAPGAEPADSADALDRLVRVQRADNLESWLFDRSLPAQGATLDAKLTDRASAIAAEVDAGIAAEPSARGGSHSSAVVVVDDAGNIAAGTHTIEALPWGEALFVGGIPLPTSAEFGWDNPQTATNRMELDGLTNTIVLDQGKPVAALAVYGVGLHPGDVQILDAVLGRGLSPEDAVLAPRVGYFVTDLAAGTLDLSTNAVDSRFPASLLCEVASRGIALQRSMPGYPPGIVDTGFPTIVTIAPGALHGMTPELMNGVAAGD